ncbi:zinc ABC transporter substrate-binding protein AdcA [Vagococcus vulneris]|uniref:Zinc ABC transporter substrate-binding protein AdcA n=1 Tax=Vagococcus vulneris TaxID=1977869 RepID=A0A430A1P0_9ENTE|nr:zinc ABC transporter substrate-binding protein AdcA [Vagococcus vulneris]
MVLISAGVLAACGNQSQSAKKVSEKHDNLKVVTTFYPMYDFTKNIVGDEGDVSLLIPAGTEAHDYEPTAKDMAKIEDADVLVYHNENMEGWVEKAAESWKKGQPNVIKGTEGMVLLAGEGHDHDHDEETHDSDKDHDHDEEHKHNDDHDHEEHNHSHALDPHTWLAPNRAIQEVESMTNQLSKLYPKKEKAFKTNAEKYIQELSKLDESYKEALSNAANKQFVTQHAAFGYLALEYGLTQVPIAGLTPHDEPTPAKLAELKKYIDKNQIKYIYAEQNTSDKIAKTLAKETDVELAELNTLEGLSQKDIDSGKNYVSVMNENLIPLKKTAGTKGAADQSSTNETEKTVHNGYFLDKDVKDRGLSDYVGNWQSVYPLLENGSLDQVFDMKAKIGKDKTAAEYKKYYTMGYKTDVNHITITDKTMTFEANGKKQTYQYKYVGKEILTYKKGNRGVRFLFETEDKDAGPYKYVQFSDHNIGPVKTEHFHIYFGGESQKKLLEEMDNWPTYYPSDLSAHAIAQEMMAH